MGLLNDFVQQLIRPLGTCLKRFPFRAGSFDHRLRGKRPACMAAHPVGKHQQAFAAIVGR